MRILSFAFAAALLIPSMAQAAPQTVRALGEKGEGMGLKAGLGLAFSSPNKAYNADGDSADIEGSSQTYLLINLNLDYDAAALAPGLFFGLDLPMVRNAVSPDQGDSVSSMGVGDVSLYGGYMMPATDQLEVGGSARIKLATGKADELEADELPLGSNYMNVQLTGNVNGNFDGVGLYVDLGYILTMAKDDLNPGDFIFANLAVGYLVADMIEPRLKVNFATSGDAAFDGNSIDDSGSQWLGLGVDVMIKINEMMSAYVGFGNELDAQGVNLPYGLVLSGKNTRSGVAATAGVSATF